MAQSKRPSLYDLAKAGDKVILKGTLTFSTLREKRKPTRQSKYPEGNTPCYTVTIMDPEVVVGADNDLGKNIARVDEVTHGFYKSKSGKLAGHVMWSFESRSKYPINILTKETEDDTVPAPDILEKELAAGQEVEILFSLYHNNKRDVVSGQLDGVRIESPENIKYYGGKSLDYSDALGKGKGTLQKYATQHPDKSDTQADDASDTEAGPEAEEDDPETQAKADSLFSD